MLLHVVINTGSKEQHNAKEEVKCASVDIKGAI
jgi:hypothetical protein